MKRPWLVRPDQVMRTETYGDVAYVSREKAQEAFLDAEALVARAGGHVTITSSRHPTDYPGEMVTEALLFEWRDRTDAKAQAEQPARAEVVPAEKLGGQFEVASPVVPEPGIVDERDVVETEAPGDSVGDGLDETELEEEDLSSIPESVR